MRFLPKREISTPSGWSSFRYAYCDTAIYVLSLTIRQVLTGEQPFRNIKPLELAYHVSLGVRPEKPANADAIGISDSLWKLMQRCWEGDRTRRPRIQEVVAGICDAATDWHTDMPPSSTEHREDSDDEEDSDELKYSKFLLVLIAPFS